MGTMLRLKIQKWEKVVMMSKNVKEFITPAKLNLFTIRQNMKEITDKQKFHSVIAR